MKILSMTVSHPAPRMVARLIKSDGKFLILRVVGIESTVVEDEDGEHKTKHEPLVVWWDDEIMKLCDTVSDDWKLSLHVAWWPFEEDEYRLRPRKEQFVHSEHGESGAT